MVNEIKMMMAIIKLQKSADVGIIKLGCPSVSYLLEGVINSIISNVMMPAIQLTSSAK